MQINEDLHRFQLHMYNVIVYTTWILYIVILLGVSSSAPEYLDDLQSFVKIYVSLFLIYRFNPLRRVKFTELDAKIAFSAGIFLLTTTAIDRIVKMYLNKIKEYVKIKKN